MLAELPDLPGLAAAIDSVCDADVETLADGESVLALLRQHERLGAALTRAVGAFERRGEWAADGARTAAVWLAVESRLPKRSLQRRVALARDLVHLPGAESSWLQGAIGEAHVARLARARNDRTAAGLGRDEAMLVEQANELRFDQFERVIAYWQHLHDDDGVEDRARRDRERRRVHLSPGLDGIGFLDGRLDPVGHAIVGDVLTRIETELFRRDWDAAKERLGADPTVADLDRTPAQRRHDALVEMARRAAAVPPGARKPDPLFVALVDYETFAGRVCELAGGTVVAPGALVPWLTEADIERAVFGAGNRVMNVSVRQRLFSGATRRAVELRDRECYHPYCDVPASDCEIDHVQPWAAGGLTIDANGRCACGFHNRLRQGRTGGDEPPATAA